MPHAEVNESDAADIEVIACPGALLVEAKTERRLEPTRDSMRAGVLESGILYRRFDLTAPIETDCVTARIDEGSLTIQAPKKLARRISVRAAAA